MGKNKTRQNVFKVAGSRSLKAKNKAKTVNIKLKKVAKNLLQSKTEEINAQLKSLEAVVRRSDPPKKSDSTVVKPAVKSPEEIVEKYESDLRKADEALDGLANFSVTTGGDE